MNKINCIIIEDEEPAQEVLKSFLSRVEWLNLSAVFDNALSALEYLPAHEVDLIFLDIQMPSLNGIEFLKTSKNLPQVILTTAYSEYAIEAFDLDVTDYLVKPISFGRFLKAVNRIEKKPDPKNVYQMTAGEPANKSVAFFNVNKTMVKVKFDDVLYIESMREYVYIHLPGNKIITKIGIGEMEKILGDKFFRVHRSYIVNKDKITSYNAEEIFIDKISLPIGPNYKKLIEMTFTKMAVNG